MRTDMTKEEFKQLRAEAGFQTDSDFARALNISVQNINSWHMGYNRYPKYLRNILTLFKLNNHFDPKEYNEFLSTLALKSKTRFKRGEKNFLEKAKIIFKNTSPEKLEKENEELKRQIKYLEDLIFEFDLKKVNLIKKE